MEQPKRGNRKVLDIFLPGMINVFGHRGRFPAISITGYGCALSCEHCKGTLLRSMYHVRTPQELKKLLSEFEEKGMHGVLLSGGCDINGKMPWDRFLPHLMDFNTTLYLIAHGGLYVSRNIAKMFKNSVIRQVLVDITCDHDTLREIYHIKEPSIIVKTLDNLYCEGIDVAPHIIIGIYKGKIKGEIHSLDLLSRYQKEKVILVILMPEVLGTLPPPLDEVVEVFRYARSLFKRVTLGCARPRGEYRRALEERLISEGLIDAMALWSNEAIKKAKDLGYTTNFYEGCCAITLRKHLPILEKFHGIRVS